MKTTLLVLLLLSMCMCYSQVQKEKIEDVKTITTSNPTYKFDKKFDVFLAAGISKRFGDNYNVTISPINQTVQFEKTSGLSSGISTGIVWQPFSFYYLTNPDANGKYQDVTKKRNGFAIALLLNIFKLNYGDSDLNNTSPIDVGFGIGYKSDNFLILVTSEFTPIRQPRQYFIDSYKDKDIKLIYSGTVEPVRTISVDDDSIFITKLYPSIGLKIAYSFGGL